MPGAQNVRVVQRNLVYVVGLSMDLCYEDVLQSAEHFGQFGKVVKARGPAPPSRRRRALPAGPARAAGGDAGGAGRRSR